MRAFISACLFLATPLLVLADDQYDLTGMMRPGLWETTTQQISADGEAGPVETDRECVTREDLQDFSSFARGEDDQTVTVEKFERGDDFVSYRMGFASDDPRVDVSGTMSGDMQFDGPERYRGTMTFSMKYQDQAFESHTKIDARRLRDCSGDGDIED